MDADEDAKQEKEPPKAKSRAMKHDGRTWKERYEQPVKYCRYTAPGFDGKPRIFFKFDLPPGQHMVDPEVYAILKELKHLDRSPERGGGVTHTGLRNRNATLWHLPDTEIGRTAADIIGGKLRDLAHKMKQESGIGR